METTALRIHGEMDLRLDKFDLPRPGPDEILAEVICDSICMSSYKAAKQGPRHKRVPSTCAENPTILGHEFAGRIMEVGSRWQSKFSVGDRFGIQPALMYKGSLDSPGYSFTTIGGDATYVLIPSCVMEMDCLLHYGGEGYFLASLSEPMSCIIGACHAQYHMKPGSYEHHMGIIENGKTALLASAGPMGLGLIDYLLNGPRQPELITITDIDESRLRRARELFPPENGEKNGVKLVFINAAQDDPVQSLMDISDGEGYNDVFVMAAVSSLIAQADALLTRDGCLNFFAGPTTKDFTGNLNFYNVHYNGTHLVGTSGGNTDDIREALDLIALGNINPASLVTHVGGLTAAGETTLHLPDIPGGKKLIYTHLDMPLAAIEDFAQKAENNPIFLQLDEICKRNNGLWSIEAEKLLLKDWPNRI